MNFREVVSNISHSQTHRHTDADTHNLGCTTSADHFQCLAGSALLHLYYTVINRVWGLLLLQRQSGWLQGRLTACWCSRFTIMRFNITIQWEPSLLFILSVQSCARDKNQNWGRNCLTIKLILHRYCLLKSQFIHTGLYAICTIVNKRANNRPSFLLTFATFSTASRQAPHGVCCKHSFHQ